MIASPNSGGEDLLAGGDVRLADVLERAAEDRDRIEIDHLHEEPGGEQGRELRGCDLVDARALRRVLLGRLGLEDGEQSHGGEEHAEPDVDEGTRSPPFSNRSAARITVAKTMSRKAAPATNVQAAEHRARRLAEDHGAHDHRDRRGERRGEPVDGDLDEEATHVRAPAETCGALLAVLDEQAEVAQLALRLATDLAAE